MRGRRLRDGRSWPLAFILLAAVACTEPGGAEAESPLPSMSFLENASALGGYVGETFRTNLLFSTRAGTGEPDIGDVRLLPEASWLRVADFRVSENDPGEDVRRWHLGVGVEANAPGTHAFRSIEISRGSESRRLPLGEIVIEIQEGPPSDVLVLMQSGGIHPAPIPYAFALKNTTPDPVTLRQIVVPGRRIHFDASAIQVQSRVLPPEGFTLQPGEEVEVLIDWTVDWTDEPLNLEARGVMAVERRGTTEWAGLHNTVFRNDPTMTP